MKKTMRKRLGNWGTVLLRDPCAYCGGPADVHDHIVPLASGGESTWENATAACGPCNCAKRGKSLLSFLGYRQSGIQDAIAELMVQRTLWNGVGR